jgi:hypothetical protein
MTKLEIISKIKAIIAEHGSFTTADVMAESSPIIGSLGRAACQLAEEFYSDKVTAITYVHDREESEDYILYEDLKKDVLAHILELAKEHATQEK